MPGSLLRWNKPETAADQICMQRHAYLTRCCIIISLFRFQSNLTFSDLIYFDQFGIQAFHKSLRKHGTRHLPYFF